jgi:hypothetical protein
MFTAHSMLLNSGVPRSISNTPLISRLYRSPPSRLFRDKRVYKFALSLDRDSTQRSRSNILQDLPSRALVHADLVLLPCATGQLDVTCLTLSSDLDRKHLLLSIVPPIDPDEEPLQWRTRLTNSSNVTASTTIRSGEGLLSLASYALGALLLGLVSDSRHSIEQLTFVAFSTRSCPTVVLAMTCCSSPFLRTPTHDTSATPTRIWPRILSRICSLACRQTTPIGRFVVSPLC